MDFEQDLKIDGDSETAWTLLLAHGAGQGMDSLFMTGIAEAVVAAGIRVVRFNFPYMLKILESGKKSPPDREP